MKIQIKKFYYARCNHDTLKFPAGWCEILPILWNNKGLFCIVSRQKVENVLSLIADKKNLPTLNEKEIGTLHWEDGQLIDARAAAMLLS